MNIVLDSNVLFSAMIRDSGTRRLILEHYGLFLFPSFIFEEIKNHKDELLRKSGMSRVDFDALLDMLLEKVVVIPDEVLLRHKNKASGLVRDIDPDDAVFVACALAYPGSIIWSDDKQLKRLTKVKVLNTFEMAKLL